MMRHFRRLGLALAVSVAGLTATLTWYYAGLPKRARTDGRDAVANLTESTDEVQRRETTRVIWESLSPNDDLFTGEAIRTSTRAHAKIRLKSGVVISLDPDSLVVLDQGDKGLALDFLEGNLFVQGAGAGAAGVTLKTGQGEVSLASADVSVSKGAEGNVDLEVFRGQAELRRGDRTTALGQDQAATLSQKGVSARDDSLKVTAPRAGQTLLLDFAGGERLRLTWAKLAPGYRVRVAVGSTRGQLTPLPEDFAGEAGVASLALKPGRWFLRLEARAAGLPELASLVTPFELAPRAAPAPLEPAADQIVLKTAPESPDVHFRWLNRHPFAQQMFEVARDERFATVSRRERLGGAIDHFDLKLGEGVHFWRVTGYPEDGARGLASVIRRVRVSARAADERVTLAAPADHARVTAATARADGVHFTWRGSARTLVVRDARGDVARQIEATEAAAHVRDLDPGTYRWTVGDAKPFELTVLETPRLAWADEAAPSELAEYAGETPTLDVGWRAFTGATQYRYRVAAAGEALERAPWRTVAVLKAQAPVPADGRYQIEVEALDRAQRRLAAAPARNLEVRRRPPLAAPAWASAAGTVRSDARGNANLEWNAVTGARGYVLSITDGGGHVTKKTFGRGPASLNRLKPGQYQLKVQGVDEFDRPGEPSPAKTLDVPNASDIRAPKIKAMKVR